MRRTLAFAVALVLARAAAADAVVLHSGERFIGDVTEEGDSLRIRNERFPDGVVVRKSDVKTRYPKPEDLLDRLAATVRKARERYDAGKREADPNPAMKDVVAALFEPELEATEAAEIYPSHRKEFDDLLKGIHELRKLARDAQRLDGPAPEPKPAPKPGPAPDPAPAPGPDPAPVPGARGALFFAGPDGASQADLEKAARALSGRCGVFGCKGVAARVETGADGRARVRLDVEGGFSAETTAAVEAMARFAARTFEMRLYPTESILDMEKYPVPQADQIAGAPAPAGTRWFARVRFVAGGDVRKEPVLMRTQPTIARGEVFPPYRDKDDLADSYYVISDAAETRLKSALRGGGVFRCEMVVDDVVIVSDVTPTPVAHPKDGRVWWRHTFADRERRLMDGYRLHAMPFALRRVEGEGK